MSSFSTTPQYIEVIVGFIDNKIKQVEDKLFIKPKEDEEEKINEISEESICDMVGNIPDNLIHSLGEISKLGEQGENSIVYKIKDKGISIKIMKNTDKNKRNTGR